MDQDLFELLPYSEDSEKGFLCSLAIHPQLFDEATGMKPSLFHIPAHQIIFDHLSHSYQDYGTTEFTIVRDTFRLTEIAEIGGLQALSELYGFVPTHVNWRFYLERLVDFYRRRSVISEARLLIRKMLDIHGQSYDQSKESVRDMCEKGWLRISQLNEALSVEKMLKEIMVSSLDAIKHYEAENYLLEISNLRSLNLALGRLMPGELLVIGAETSQGKTALALNMACHMALGEQRKKVALFSFEMTKQTLVERMLSSGAQVPLRDIRDGELSAEQKVRIDKMIEGIPSERTIVMEDSFGLDVAGIVSRCRMLKVTGELDVVIVDYLQLVNPSAFSRDSSRQREVAEISRRLKVIAGELQVVVIALSQLNDDGKLRESRAIGQDADIILIISEPKNSDDCFEREIYIDKCRNGQCGQRVKVDFFGEYVSFADKS
jgi:replicative DNA helicase